MDNAFGRTTAGARLIGGSGRYGQAIGRLDVHSNGAGMRFVASWDGCPPSMGGTSVTMAGTDYDFLLCNPTTMACVSGSQSFDDNVESFSVSGLPSGQYDLMYLHDRQTCTPSIAVEPIAWVGAVWGNITWTQY